MDVREFMNRFQERYPEVDRFELEDHQGIREFEDRLGWGLPLSFCTFLSEFFNDEPIGELARNRLVGQFVRVM